MTPMTTATLAGLSARLRAKRIDGDLNKVDGFGRDQIPDPDCSEAATAIEALLARIAALESGIEDIRQMTDPDDPESYRNDDRSGCLDTVFATAAALTLKENDDAIG